MDGKLMNYKVEVLNNNVYDVSDKNNRHINVPTTIQGRNVWDAIWGAFGDGIYMEENVEKANIRIIEEDGNPLYMFLNSWKWYDRNLDNYVIVKLVDDGTDWESEVIKAESSYEAVEYEFGNEYDVAQIYRSDVDFDHANYLCIDLNTNEETLFYVRKKEAHHDDDTGSSSDDLVGSYDSRKLIEYFNTINN